MKLCFNRTNDILTSLQVCDNGMLSLEKPFETYIPQKLPISTPKAPLICPFWTDVNLGKGGNLWSRESRDTDLLQQVSKDGRLNS